jgi:hypothetical protein
MVCKACNACDIMQKQIKTKSTGIAGDEPCLGEM